jgi:leucyl-tRNA synthetase
MRPLQVWSTKGVEGVHRFLARVYRLVTEGGGLTDEQPSRDQLRLLHQTIKKVRREEAVCCNAGLAGI